MLFIYSKNQFWQAQWSHETWPLKGTKLSAFSSTHWGLYESQGALNLHCVTCTLPEELIAGVKTTPVYKDLQGNAFLLKEREKTTNT